MPDNPETETAPCRLPVDVVRAQAVATEVRARSEDAPLGTLVGDFSVFGSWYEINSIWEGHFIERLQPGAFKRTINNRSGQSPVRVLLEHGFDPQVGDKPLGVPRVLEERATGVYAETPLLDTSYNRDLAPALEAGAYGQSFRFQVRSDEWAEPATDAWEDTGRAEWADLPQRTITEVKLAEFGPTVWPASPDTNNSTGLRSATDAFYEALARRDTSAYEEAVRSVRGVCPPESAKAGETQRTSNEDPQDGHPEDPAAQTRDHSEGSPVTHSENAPSNPIRKEPVMEPMTVEERAARQSEIRARLTEIDQQHPAADLPEEVRTEWDSLNDELDTHTRAIAAAEERRARLAAIDPDSEQGRRSTVHGADNGPTAVRKPENIFDLSEARSRARSVDELPAIYRDRAMRAVEQARFPGVADREEAQRRVERLLDTVDDADGTLARKILVTGSPVYSRAFGKALMSLGTSSLTAEEQRALSLGADASGGFAVPFQLDPTVILTSDGVADPLRQISRVEQITGKEWQGVSSAGVTVSRSPEGAEVGENSPNFAQPSVKTTRVTGFVPFSVELDSAWSQLQSEITTILNDAKATEEAGTFMNGSGTGEEPEGLITALLAAGAPTVVKTGAVNSFAVDDVYAVEDALPPRHLASAAWLANRSIYNRVRAFDPNGTSLWNRLGAGTPPELIGYPSYKASEMGSDITADIFAVLGNFKRFLIVDRIGMRVELVPHLLGANGRPTGQRGILAIWDNACKVLDPNAFRALQGHSA